MEARSPPGVATRDPPLKEVKAIIVDSRPALREERSAIMRKWIIGAVIGLGVLGATACAGQTYNITDSTGKQFRVRLLSPTEAEVTDVATGMSFRGNPQQLLGGGGQAAAPQQTAPSPSQAAPAQQPQAAPAQNPTASGSSPSASGSLTSTNIVVRLMDGRSPDPRETADKKYDDTGVGKTKTWSNLNIPDGETGLFWGVTLKYGDEFYDKGVMKVIPGPATVNELSITDGGRHTIPNVRVNGEICIRLKQHLEEGWLMTDYSGPPQHNPMTICR